jgi:predicted esterase
MSSDASPLHDVLSVPVALHLLAVRPAGTGETPFPILLVMHGYAMDAASMLSLAGRMSPAEFLIVSIEGPHSTMIPGSESGPERKAGFHWGVSPRAEDNRAAHRASVAAAIEWSVRQGGDAKRVSLLAFSQPCSFNYRLALDPPHGEPFRALVGLCGGVPGEWSAAPAQPSESSPAAVLHVSTREDPFYSLERVARFPGILATRFGSVKHRLDDGAHRVPSAAFDEIRSFLSAHG